MPDLHRLQDFLQRTQAHMQAALDSGDQGAVDQYENFLDRSNAVAEREMAKRNGGPQSIAGLAGPGGEPGQEGQAGAQDAPPQLQEQAPQFTQGSLVAPPQGAQAPQKLQLDLQEETKGSSSPLIQQMINGVPKAPPVPYTGPSSGGVVDQQPKGWGDYVNTDILKKIAGYAIPIPGWNPVETGEAIGNAQKFIEGFPSSPQSPAVIGLPWAKAFGGGSPAPKGAPAKPKPQAAMAAPGSPDVTNEPSVQLSNPPLMPEAGAKPAQDDVMMEIARLKQQLGDKPSFFTLENLAMLLLMGAPRAYSHFKEAGKDWGNKQMSLDQLGMQYKFGKSGDKAKQDHWAQQAALEREKAGGTLLPHIVSAKQKPLESQRNDNSAEMRTILNNPQTDMTKASDPNVVRYNELKRENAEIDARLAEIADQSYSKKK